MLLRILTLCLSCGIVLGTFCCVSFAIHYWLKINNITGAVILIIFNFYLVLGILCVVYIIRKSKKTLSDNIELRSQDQATGVQGGDPSPIQNITGSHLYPGSQNHHRSLAQTLARPRSSSQGRTNASFDNSLEKDDPPPAYNELFPNAQCDE